MKTLLQKSFTRRCPRCNSLHVCRSSRKTLIENVGLRFALLRPYRCESCGDRYYGFALQRRAALPGASSRTRELPGHRPVLVYGCGRDNEPFSEEASIRMMNSSGAVVWIQSPVEPGQKLVVFGSDSEDGRKCRVSYVADESAAGKRMVGVVFTRAETRPLAVRPATGESLSAASQPATVRVLKRKALAS
jgi:hypothetical protein